MTEIRTLACEVCGNFAYGFRAACKTCGRLGSWVVVYSDGHREFCCSTHAPAEGRIYTNRCEVPGCAGDDGIPRRSVKLCDDNVRRCEVHMEAEPTNHLANPIGGDMPVGPADAR